MPGDNIFAFTAPGLSPEFISVNTEGDAVEFIVRSPTFAPGESYGDTASTKLTLEQARELGRKLAAL